MRKQLAIFLTVGALLGCMAAVALLVWLPKMAGGAAAGTLPSGRSVTTTSDSLWLRSRFQQDTATIETSGYTIVVAPDAVLVNGRRYAQIDRTAKDVRLNVANQEVRIVADGKAVQRLR